MSTFLDLLARLLLLPVITATPSTEEGLGGLESTDDSQDILTIVLRSDNVVTDIELLPVENKG